MTKTKCIYIECQNNEDGDCKFNFPSECELIAIKCEEDND